MGQSKKVIRLEERVKQLEWLASTLAINLAVVVDREKGAKHVDSEQFDQSVRESLLLAHHLLESLTNDETL